MKRRRPSIQDFEDPSTRPRPNAPPKRSSPPANSSGGFVRDAFSELMQNPRERQQSLASESPPMTPGPLTINDRQSKFIGHSAAITSRKELDAVVASISLNNLLKTATHNIRAWRYLNLRPGRSGDKEDDFVVMEGHEDDGEQWAGKKLLQLMQVSGACDCVVIVTRWYGGELLGPVRFQHIDAVALSALHAGGFINSPQGLTKTSTPSSTSVTPGPAQPLPPVDTPNPISNEAQTAREKSIRLLRARDGTIESLKHQTQKLQLRVFENQKSIRTLRGTREDDLAHVEPPPAPSPIKGPPPASEYAGLENGELELRIKEKDDKIFALKNVLGEWKERLAIQEKRIMELSFVAAKVGVD
ncbi:hypothetical protein HDU67_007251 [Dinochytrium kinnereticum]|nr:hypothetical protein HDU67_007251 [Dinochytrium kinnereticum]